jgi:hypothetical protein
MPPRAVGWPTVCLRAGAAQFVETAARCLRATVGHGWYRDGIVQAQSGIWILIIIIFVAIQMVFSALPLVGMVASCILAIAGQRDHVGLRGTGTW